VGMPRVSRTKPRVDDRPLGKEFGQRLKRARLAAGLTQTQLAEPRYTKAFVSALENGLSRPSIAALRHFSARLGIPASQLINDEANEWGRLEADLLLACGRWDDAIDAYSSQLDGLPAPSQRPELLVGLAEALIRRGRAGEALAIATEAAELFRSANRQAEASLAEYWAAAAHYQRENAAEANAILHAILARVRAGVRVAPDFQARVLMALSSNESRIGNHSAALAYLEEVRGLSADLDDRRRASFLFDLAYSYRETGDYEAAIRTGIASLELFRRAEAEREAGSLENDLAMSYLAVGNTVKATEMAASARARCERLGDEWLLGHVLDSQACIGLAQGDVARAAALASQALELAQKTENRKAGVDALMTLARARVAMGDAAGGLEANEQAGRLAREDGGPALVRKALGAWAEALAAAGEHERAYALMHEAAGPS
jgi:transcriptional regulator with XRE-family HTH domain